MEHLPELNLSLKLINTVNAFPQPSSFENMELAVIGTATGEAGGEGGEDSLGERISHVATAAHSAKKKRAGCTCKKTFCLKMYCECFSSGRDCGEGCDCRSCKNTAEVRGAELAKGGAREAGLRNCSLADKRCNCKKSGCQKRYCECFNSGLTCSEACGCEGCKNMEPLPSLPSFQRPEHPEHPEEEREHPREPLRDFPSLRKCGSLDDF